MDEVHNLVRPSMEILRNEKRCLMLQRLRHLLRTAENSVIIGLTGTPLCDVPAESAALLNLIKGRHHQSLSDEGFVSYYMSTPPSVFPRVFPRACSPACRPHLSAACRCATCRRHRRRRWAGGGGSERRRRATGENTRRS